MFSIFRSIASGLPDFVLRKISVFAEGDLKTLGFDTYEPPIIYTRPLEMKVDLSLRRWCSQLLTGQRAGLEDCPVAQRSSQ